MARRLTWRLILRIEDLDGPRVKPGADAQAIDDLRWLGLDWDGQVSYQRADLRPYAAALQSLRERGLVYPCDCSRRQIEQAHSAPHGDVHETRYRGTCRHRPAGAMSGDTLAWRVMIPDEAVEFHDEVHGRQSVNVQRQTGDFIVATKQGLPAYQLAVVVDDARQGVTDVVRGDDLLSSAARQLWLYRLLDLRPLPRYWHLPLVIGHDGRRLAKRHGDTRVAWYRGHGVKPERIIGLTAFWSGASAERQPMDAGEFLRRFDIARLPRRAVTFLPEDHAWLLGS